MSSSLQQPVHFGKGLSLIGREIHFKLQAPKDRAQELIADLLSAGDGLTDRVSGTQELFSFRSHGRIFTPAGVGFHSYFPMSMSLTVGRNGKPRNAETIGGSAQ